MILDPVIISLCMTFNTETQGAKGNVCNQTLTEISESTKTTAMINSLESYSRNLIEGNVNKEILYPTIAIGALIDSYSKKQVIANFPLKPVIDEVNLNLTPDVKAASFKWIWRF